MIDGDWRFFWQENIKDQMHFPYAWDASLNTGMGKSSLGSLWINSYLNFTSSFNTFGFSWVTISYLFWIVPALIIGFISSYFLFKSLFPKKNKIALLSGFIYLFNTYFSMIFFGGQLGVSIAFALAPFILRIYILTLQKLEVNIRNLLMMGFLLGIQILFDPRVTYITVVSLVLLFIFNIVWNMRGGIVKIIIIQSFISLFIPLGISAILHSFWIIPLFIYKSSLLPQGYDSISYARFFSFALFENSFSLLHPNWPENIFGKVYFMRPEFLILPILAYGSLLFTRNSKSEALASRRSGRNPKQILNSKYEIQNNLTMKQFNNETILFFALLGLFGAFLAKGTNEPFGQVYTFLFQYLPGFTMFRDPTKFYLFVALSYSVLIPFSIWQIQDEIRRKIKNRIYSNIFLILTILFFIYLIHPAILKVFKNLVESKPIPNEYVMLKDFLSQRPEFFRTLWIPEWQRFGYFSNVHPAIGRGELIKISSPSAMIRQLKDPKMLALLQNVGVKYVIVPYDSEGEIFLNDRKYDKKQHENTISQLATIPWLKRIKMFREIGVFELLQSKDHFYFTGDKKSQARQIKYSYINPTKYIVEVYSEKDSVLVFSESFDPYWTAKIEGDLISSEPYDRLLNSFRLPKQGNYRVEIFYKPQYEVYVGTLVSISSLIGIIIVIGVLSYKQKIYDKCCNTLI